MTAPAYWRLISEPMLAVVLGRPVSVGIAGVLHWKVQELRLNARPLKSESMNEPPRRAVTFY